MAEFKHPDQGHIFILKVWQEVLSDDQEHAQFEWRGKIQDVRNGETHYFRDWPAIVHFISTVLPETEAGNSHPPHKRKERPAKRTLGAARPRVSKQ